MQKEAKWAVKALQDHINTVKSLTRVFPNPQISARKQKTGEKETTSVLEKPFAQIPPAGAETWREVSGNPLSRHHPLTLWGWLLGTDLIMHFPHTETPLNSLETIKWKWKGRMWVLPLRASPEFNISFIYSQSVSVCKDNTEWRDSNE